MISYEHFSSKLFLLQKRWSIFNVALFHTKQQFCLSARHFSYMKWIEIRNFRYLNIWSSNPMLKQHSFVHQNHMSEEISITWLIDVSVLFQLNPRTKDFSVKLPVYSSAIQVFSIKSLQRRATQLTPWQYKSPSFLYFSASFIFCFLFTEQTIDIDIVPSFLSLDTFFSRVGLLCVWVQRIKLFRIFC